MSLVGTTWLINSDADMWTAVGGTGGRGVLGNEYFYGTFESNNLTFSYFSGNQGYYGTVVKYGNENVWNRDTGWIDEAYRTVTFTSVSNDRQGDAEAWINANAVQVIPPVDYKVTDVQLNSIADAINTKAGTTGQLQFPDGFVSAIGAISTGTDVSDTTATASDVRNGKYFYTANGTKTQGSIADMTLPTGTAASADGTNKGTISRSTYDQYINIPVGYNESKGSYKINAVPNGSVTIPTTSITANPSISVDSDGLITADVMESTTITPTVSEGYVSSVTPATASVLGSNTKQLATQAAQTIHPSTTNQTVSSGKYLIGNQTFKAVTMSNLTAGNIKSGVVVKIGDSDDDDRVASVTGSYAPSLNTTTLYVKDFKSSTSISLSSKGYRNVALTCTFSSSPTSDGYALAINSARTSSYNSQLMFISIPGPSALIRSGATTVRVYVTLYNNSSSNMTIPSGTDLYTDSIGLKYVTAG